jgi:hypothetical protein
MPTAQELYSTLIMQSAAFLQAFHALLKISAVADFYMCYIALEHLAIGL